MTPTLRRTLHGALGGAMGAACMTVLRMLAHRAGLIEQMVPQAVEVWAQHTFPGRAPRSPSARALHHILDQSLHIGYGMSGGAVYGLLFGQTRASAKTVLAFGFGVWGVGSFIVLPALKIMRPEWRASAREIAVNLSAHLAYASALALCTDELEQQALLQPVGYPLSLSKTTG